MIPDGFHDFFIALVGVGGALVGLLFVAISVATDRVTGPRASVVEQARAAGALTAFLAPVIIGLVSLLPGTDIGTAAVITGSIGLLSTVASARRSAAGAPRRRDAVRRIASAVGLAAVMVLDLVNGIELLIAPDRRASVGSLAVLGLVSLLLGVDRAWLLIGARDRGTVTAVRDLIQPARAEEDPGEGQRMEEDGDAGSR